MIIIFNAPSPFLLYLLSVLFVGFLSQVDIKGARTTFLWRLVHRNNRATVVIIIIDKISFFLISILYRASFF